ncbi:hypothetical protein AB0J42_35580 [Nonomuraea sp. NPDC049649]|uniref:hypothetical protein n=1 Tax=Nonomuraea sp. NPDC049649 TaxID=3155776 RepID=UPI0034327AB8
MQFKPLPDSLPPARRKFTEMMRTLLSATGGTLRSVAVADGVLSSSSALQRLASGQVKNPSKELIFALRKHAEDNNAVGLVTEEELLCLLQQVWDESRQIAAGPAVITVTHPDDEAPAVPAAETGARSVAPVPASDGDRRNGLVPGTPWPVDELVLHLDSGRYEHALGMLDYAGTKAPAEEAAAAIKACRSRDLTEAREILLRKVGARSEKIVFEVINHLIHVGDVMDAQELARMRSCA